MGETKSFGEWLRQRRRELDLTQEELARQVGCARITVRKLEADQMRPSKQLTELLIEHLGIPAQERENFIRFARGGSSPDQIMTAAPQKNLPYDSLSSLAGRPETQTSPTGIVTFLFTDIQGTTRLWQEQPQAMTGALARHNQILRTAIESNHGYIFQVIGDAFCSAFHTPQDAVRAAVQSQTDLQFEQWGATPIRVRMGIHTGQAEIQKSGDYQGFLTLTRVQRLMSAGHGGQVLISPAAQELMRNQLPEGISLRDMGEHRLDEVIRPERIYQLNIPGLSMEFAPLKTLDVYRHNLPAQLTSFIGREKELAEIQNALAEYRLVTLTGSGGTGKTRMALKLATGLLDQFQDGVWFIDLAPLTQPDLIGQTILSIFEIGEQQGKTARQTLADYLREKKSLLILDNCEHLIATCAELAESLLRTCLDLRILATSREALRIEGERLWEVPPLSFPNPSADTKNIGKYTAVQLFVDRALQVRPEFQLTVQNAPWIAEISRRLDGIPLAIELAAARLNALSVEEIAARLVDRFNLLSEGSRTALPHHQTLRATLEWSYELLSESERLLIRRLSVFAGGWSLEVAEAVCAGDGIAANEILDLESRLVNRSLVVLDHLRDGGATTRYRMLETIREFAQEKLSASGEETSLRDRHLKFFTEWTERIEPKLRNFEQLACRDQMEMEHDNLRSALVWSQTGGDAHSGLRLAGAAHWFWERRGYVREGLKWLKELLGQSPNQERTPARAKALIAAVDMATDLIGQDQLKDWCAESLEFWREVGDKWWTAYTLTIKGWELLYARNIPSAQARLEEAVRLAREVEDPWIIGYTLRGMGAVIERYDYAAARAILEESISILKTVGDRWLLATAIMQLTTVALGEGDYLQAVSLSEESLRIYRDIGDQWETSDSLSILALAMFLQGNIGRAAELARECLSPTIFVGDIRSIAQAMMAFAGIAGVERQPRRCAILLAAAEALLNSIGLTMEIWRSLFTKYEQIMATTREQLNEAEFRNAMEEGKSMTKEQAIDYALK
jgi:predicted ATPase/class 3 adenylate cyclase/DNA-binding XRE family transcriptional regulator